MTAAATVSTAAGPMPLSRRRRAVVWTLVVLASVVAFVSILTTWVDRQMLDNHAWRNASEELIGDPAVRSALSVYLVNQLYDNVDVAQALERRLPDNLDALAAPVAGALRSPATNAVGVILARPRVQRLWIEATTRAHEMLVNVLEDETGYGIATGNGVVTLDLHTLVAELGRSLGVPEAALEKLPAGAGVVTVMRSDQLDAAQKAVRAVKALSLWLVVAVLGLYALAVFLARGIRRRTLRNIGWALVLVGLLTLVARRLIGSYVIDSLTTPEYERTGHDLWLIATSILGQIGRAAIFYGVIVVLGAVLAGPTQRATAVRRRLAPVLNERQGVAWGAVGTAYVLLVLWGGTHALRTWWGILLLGGLLALGVVALRRQTLHELVAAPAGAELHDGAPIADAEPRRGKQTVLR